MLQHADHIGSTAAILKFARESEAREIIVATEPGILHQMSKENPDKVFLTVPAPTRAAAATNAPT